MRISFQPHRIKLITVWFTCLLALVLLAGAVVSDGSAAAQASGSIQIQKGIVPPGSVDVYRLHLQPGQTLSALAANESGNLDPVLIVLSSDENLAELYKSYSAKQRELILNDVNLPQSIYDLRDATFPAWDDDSGSGHDAYLEFSPTRAGDYYVLVSSAFTTTDRATSGGYRLVLGLDTDEVLAKDSPPKGELFAEFEQTVSTQESGVEEETGFLEPGTGYTEYELEDIHAGDTLYVFVERTNGDFFPALGLLDNGNKSLSVANLVGESTTAGLKLAFDETTSGLKLQILPNESSPAGAGGEFRLQVGINDPEIASGTAVPGGQFVIKTPIPVEVGVKLLQIVDVEQSMEFFTAVGSLRMDWSDPRNAFSPDSCNCREKFFSEANFSTFLREVEDRWPDFSFANQQGNRWVQNRAVVLRADGSAIYYELFTTNFQVDFDFRRFPFDVQTFLIRVDQLLPSRFYIFTELPGYSEISSEHGEDEFILTNFQTNTSIIPANTGTQNSRYTFTFDAPRHLEYYILQVFIPVLLIAIISWLTFFLRDYTRRIEAAAANILLFIAFSFSLTENYPRLGYLTFLDALMATTFIVNTAVVAYNVYLKQLESRGLGERAERIDRVMDWVYPLMYLVAIGVLYLIFFQASA